MSALRAITEAERPTSARECTKGRLHLRRLSERTCTSAMRCSCLNSSTNYNIVSRIDNSHGMHKIRPSFRLFRVSAALSATEGGREPHGSKARQTADSLSEPPNPNIVWYCVPSLTTISALAAAAGVTKLMGLLGASDVKSFDRSQVVCH